MVAVGLLTRHTEADQGDDRGARVGEVVEGISHDRDRAADDASKKLDGEKQDVQNDSHDAAKSAVSTSHHGRRGIRAVLDEDFGK